MILVISGTNRPGARTLAVARAVERVLREAVRRMLPKNALAKHMLRKLKLYTGDSHKHQAQQPEPLPL